MPGIGFAVFYAPITFAQCIKALLTLDFLEGRSWVVVVRGFVLMRQTDRGRW